MSFGAQVDGQMDSGLDGLPKRNETQNDRVMIEKETVISPTFWSFRPFFWIIEQVLAVHDDCSMAI